MNVLALLGRLPASTSARGTLDRLDWLKIARLALVVFAGTFCVKVAGTTLTDANLTQVLLDGVNAGVAALAGAALEAARRLVANQL